MTRHLFIRAILFWWICSFATASAQETTYYYGSDGSFQGYATQSGVTRHYFGGDGAYEGSSRQYSSDQNLYGDDGRSRSNSIFFNPR